MNRRLTFLIRTLIVLTAVSSPVAASIDDQGGAGAPPAAVIVDQVISATGSGTISTRSFDTSTPGELILAFAASDGPRSGGQTLGLSGAGLGWSLVRRANAQFGTSEIWTATVPTVRSGISVTSVQSVDGFHQSLTVVTFKGATEVGASAGTSGANGAAGAVLSTSQPGSLVLGVGNDWDKAIARTVAAGQTMVHQAIETAVNDTFWVQRVTDPVPAAGTLVAVATSAPIANRWNFAAVEIVAAPITRPVVTERATIDQIVSGEATGRVTTQSFSTRAPGELVVAFAASDGPASGGQQLTISGGGLPWTLVRRANAQLGTSEIWAATAPAASSNLAVTSTPRFGGYRQSLTVVAFLGASGIGASNAAGAANGAPGVLVTTTRPGSLVVGVGNDWDRATPRTIAADQVMLHQQVDTTVNDTFWVQARAGAIQAAGTPVQVADTAPTTDHWNLAAVEILTAAQPVAIPTGPATAPTVFVDGTGTVSTPLFASARTSGLLVAFVASDGPGSSPQSAAVSGAGLSWALVRRANAQAGTSEIWTAATTSPLVNATVTSTPAISGFHQSLTVVAFDPGSGVGASAVASAATGAPAVSLVATRSGALIYGVGNDWDSATARLVDGSDAIVHQWVETTSGDTFWVQARQAPIVDAGATVHLRDTSPVSDRWNFAAVEIVPTSQSIPVITVTLSPAPNVNGWRNTPVTAHFTCSAAAGLSIVSCPADQVVQTDGANQTVTGTTTDSAGSTATVRSDPFNIDSTRPTITAALTPEPNANGWMNSPVVVHFTCTDSLSAIGTCPPDQVLSTEGPDQSITGTAIDKAGNSETVSRAGLNLDFSAPSIAVALDPPPTADGWNSGPVTAHFTCADSGSGVAACPPDQTVNVDGANLTVTGTAVDRAGLSSSVTSLRFSIDLMPPAIAVTLAPAPNAHGWNHSPVTAHFTCADNVSGVATCPADQVISAEAANQQISGTAVDLAGHETVATAVVSIDTTPPLFTVVSPAPGSSVFTPTAHVVGTVSDALSGVAGASCGTAPASVGGNGAVNCQVALTPGQNTFTATATDAAGNVSTSTSTITYVRVPVVTLTSPANLSYFNITPTTVTGTVDDPAAIVTVNSIPAPVINGTFSIPLPIAEGPNIITATGTTPAGGTGTASVTVTLDTTQPHVTITSPPDQFVTTEVSISVAGIVNDIVVGTVNEEEARVTVNGVAATVANRTFLAAAVPLSIGPNTIQVVGRDRVGNAATTEIVVTRGVATQPQIRLMSGNNQSGRIGSLLSDQLVVALVDALGNPVPSKPVIFKVTQNDGLLTAGGEARPTIVATTDSQGRAQARWTLGNRAGAGGNAVEGYAIGYEGTALFTASGTQGTPGKIVVDTGNDQIGATGQSLPKPFIAVVVDDGNNRLGGVPVTFTVEEGGGTFDGQSTQTVVSDSDGRVATTLTLGAQEGNANNLVTATFVGNQSFAANFTASGRVAGNPADTVISGVVLDNSNVPVAGVTVRAVSTPALRSSLTVVQNAPSVRTDEQGQFTIAQAPVGIVKLMVDGTTAERPDPYPSLEYDMVTVAGQLNTVGQPIYILPLNEANRLCVSATSGGGTLTVPEAPGFSLTFGPGQVTFPGGSKDGCVSVTVVHGDKVPMVPGFGQQPRFIVTIQPSGAVFNPPAPITLPNVDGLAPRAVTEMYSYDHDISAFVAIGTGVVSDDGTVIRSSAGVGVLKAGWHCGGNPSGTGTAATCSICNTCVNNSCTADDSQTPPQSSPNDCKQDVCQGGGVGFVPDDSEEVLRFSAKQKKNVVDECKLCQQGGAVAGPDRTTCDDENARTVDDQCEGGTCKGTPIVIRIRELISDQFPGIKANYLPGNAGRKTAYVLMAARADGKAYARVTLTVTPNRADVAAKVRVRFYKAGIAVGSATALSPDPGNPQFYIASLSTALSNSTEDYDVAAGVDANDDGELQTDEVTDLSPFGVGFKIVPKFAYDFYRNGALTGAFFSSGLFPTAASLLQAFAGNVSPDGANTIQFSTLAKKELVHNVGADFDANGNADVPVYLFPSTSAVAQRVLLSDDFYTAVTNTMTGNGTDVRNYFAQPNSAGSRDFTWPMIGNVVANPTNLDFPSSTDLFLAFGTSQGLAATMTVTVARDGAGGLHAVAVNVAGVMTDTYAWDFDRGGLDADSAKIQAGYRTLGQGGQVFKLRVSLDGRFILRAPFSF